MKYQKPNPISFLQEDFPVGTQIINFGFLCDVIGYHVAGKMLIVRDVTDGVKWLADPDKCTIPVNRPVTKGIVPVFM